MLWPVVKALLGHYRRHPLQILLVWLGLTLGVSVLVGVLAINQHARMSYSSGEQLFSNTLPHRIQSRNITHKIPQGFYVQLRREGFNQCAPFDVYRLKTQDDHDITIIGTDPFALNLASDKKNITKEFGLSLIQAPQPILINQNYAEYLGWSEGDFIPLADGSQLGPIKIDHVGVIQGTQVMADLALVRQFRQSTGISFIGCSDMPDEKLFRLEEKLPRGMKLNSNSRNELNSLTQAFHTNLTALGMLSFLVGLFIFYQAMSLSLVQRQTIVGMLRQVGVSGWQLASALFIELVVLILGSWICGNVLGLLLANQLIPSVSLSIGAIYSANIGVSIDWSWEWSKLSLLMVCIGALLSCTWPLVRLISSQPIRLTSRVSLVRFAGKEFFWQAILAAACCTAAIAIFQAPHNSATGFIIIGLMLVGVALFMPFVVFEVFNFLSYRLRWVKLRWFFADAASSMSYRGLALMAFMLAMTANIGVETMVGSFRNTTDKWLDQRLAADIYIQPTTSSANRMTNWLMKQPEVDDVWLRWENEVVTDTGTLDVVSTGVSKGELNSLSEKITIPNYWYHLHHSKSVMISESMSIKLDIAPGDYISLPTPLGKGWQVVGVYYDYGNPFNQILLSHRNWKRAFGTEGTINLGVILNEESKPSELMSRLNETYRLTAERMEDNKDIHKQALKVFDRTFIIADTLGNLTLVIAVFGIFLSTLAGEISRQRHIALMRCLGISAKELVLLGGLQLLVFGVIAAIVAIPLGLALAQNVVDLILKHSFGWTLKLEVIPWEYFETVGWTVAALMLAGAIPVMQIINRTPMKSLRDAL